MERLWKSALPSSSAGCSKSHPPALQTTPPSHSTSAPENFLQEWKATSAWHKPSEAWPGRHRGDPSTQRALLCQHKATTIASHSKPVAMVTRYKRQSCCFPVARGIPGTWSKHSRQRSWCKEEEERGEKILQKSQCILTFTFMVWGGQSNRNLGRLQKEKRLLGSQRKKLKTFSKSQKLHKHYLLMQENAKCHVQQREGSDCISSMFSIFYIHFFMPWIIPVLAQWNQTWLANTGSWPGSAEGRTRRPVQSQSHFPVKAGRVPDTTL